MSEPITKPSTPKRSSIKRQLKAKTAKLYNLAGYFDILVQIDLAKQKLMIDKNTKE